MADGSERGYPSGMAGPAAQRSPSLASIATAWVLAIVLEAGWLVGLYNYDGEMGVTPPPPISEVIVWAITVDTLLGSGLIQAAGRYRNAAVWPSLM